MTALELQTIENGKPTSSLTDTEPTLCPSTAHVPLIIRMQRRCQIEEQRATPPLSEDEARRKSIQSWIARNRLQRARNRGWSWLRNIFR